MKRILRLRGEIIIIAIISVIIATVLSSTLANHIFDIKSNKVDYGLIEKSHINEINKIIEDYKDGDISYDNLVQAINNWSNKNINVYLVNYNGEVLASKEKGIKSINLDEVKANNVTKLSSKNQIEICNSINVDYDKALAYYITYYPNDPKYTLYLLGITLVSFFVLINGRMSYIELITRNITPIAGGNFNERIPIKYKNELSELAKNINLMTTKLQEEDNKKREFITNISHDLRTPLTTMLGYLKMVDESKYEDKEELEKYIAMINRKGNYLKSLLDDFFHYSKLSSKDIEVNKTNIDIQLFLEQVADEEKISFEENDLALELQSIDRKHIIRADSELMARAIYNLLSNAIRYSKKKTEVKINMTEERYEGKVYCAISIINVPKKSLNQEEIDKLFQRLYKREEERNSEGSGLGLTITQEIMKLHDGFVDSKIIDGKVEFKLRFLEV